MVEAGRAGLRGVEDRFEELVKLSRNLIQEQSSYVRENLVGKGLVFLQTLSRVYRLDTDFIRPQVPLEPSGTELFDEKLPNSCGL